MKRTPANSRVILDETPRKQHAPFYDVKAQGVTVEWTDSILDAMKAAKDAVTPVTIHKVDSLAMRRCIYSRNHFGN
jgi:hypothetical protein